jgi:predicted transcriptional regulator
MQMTSPREVREARLDIGLCQSEAAQIVGVSESTWQQWETSPMFSSYEQISFDSWERFLVETHKLRSADSRWRVREAVLKVAGHAAD